MSNAHQMYLTLESMGLRQLEQFAIAHSDELTVQVFLTNHNGNPSPFGPNSSTDPDDRPSYLEVIQNGQYIALVNEEGDHKTHQGVHSRFVAGDQGGDRPFTNLRDVISKIYKIISGTADKSLFAKFDPSQMVYLSLGHSWGATTSFKVGLGIVKFLKNPASVLFVGLLDAISHNVTPERLYRDAIHPFKVDAVASAFPDELTEAGPESHSQSDDRSAVEEFLRYANKDVVYNYYQTLARRLHSGPMPGLDEDHNVDCGQESEETAAQALRWQEAQAPIQLAFFKVAARFPLLARPHLDVMMCPDAFTQMSRAINRLLGRLRYQYENGDTDDGAPDLAAPARLAGGKTAKRKSSGWHALETSEKPKPSWRPLDSKESVVGVDEAQDSYNRR